ncbi:MAG: DUF3656 domain-containing protein [Methanoregula sp.]
MPEQPIKPDNRALPELLAPAGSKEALRAAIAAGADAVYLSGKRFGARKFAPNFSDEDLAGAIDYAHERGVRVYVTVNTLIHDRELPGVAEYLVRLYALGADAVLVQDTGLAALAREIVPGLALHASTQLSIHNADGVRWAHKHGFSRVVLARELSLQEIDEIARETSGLGVGLEVFSHGALCYSYSGQCLLSSVIGGRSGNRGMCAQPCRKKYWLVEAETDRYGRPVGYRDIPSRDKYLLSPKDLCTYRELPQLAGSPVTSLKIEGRMKSPEYVATVVSTYRRALDAVRAGTFVPDKDAERDLLLAFNRGFTKGYLFGDRHHALMGRDRPDNRGLLIGKVAQYDRKQGTAAIVMDEPVTLHPGDGLLFSPPDLPVAAWGFSLNCEPSPVKGGVRVTVPRPVEEGSRVYLTSALDLSTRARQIEADAIPGLYRPVPVELAARVDPDGHLFLSGTIHPPGRQPVPVENTSGLILVPARSRPLLQDQLAAQLEKAGGTPFVVSKLSLDYDGSLFAPLGEINRVRRDFFTRAGPVLLAACRPGLIEIREAEKRLGKYREHLSLQHAPEGNGTAATGTRNLEIVLLADNIDAVEAGIRTGAATVCFEPCGLFVPGEKHRADLTPTGESALRAALYACRDGHSKFAWKIPRIAHDGEIRLILQILPGLVAAGLESCMVDNPGTAQAVRDAVPGLRLLGSYGLNVFNARTVRVLGGEGFGLLVLSPELSKDEIQALVRDVRSPGAANPHLAVFVQGNLETMVTEDCLKAVITGCKRTSGTCRRTHWLGLKDETGRLLPVKIDDMCRSHIFNPDETMLVDAVGDLAAAGIDAVVIDARGRTADYAAEMVRIYRDIISPDRRRSKDRRATGSPRDRAKAIALGGITAGHFTHGLKNE